jgi:hypothetical protein
MSSALRAERQAASEAAVVASGRPSMRLSEGPL